MGRRRTWLAVLVFFFSMLFHAIGINQAGRTWDEQFKIDLGFIAWQKWFEGDFSVDSWKLGIEHPMVAKYLYGLFLGPHLVQITQTQNPELVRTDFSPSELIKLSRLDYVPTQLESVLYSIDYDWTYPRLVSVFFNSLALVGVFVISTWFLSDYWALLAPTILLLTPRFLAMGKQVTYESITAGLIVWTVVLFAWLLKNQQKVLPYLLVGLGVGLLVFTRYNNVYVLVLLVGWWVIHQLSSGKKKLSTRLFNWHLIFIPLIVLIFGYLTWPLLWHEFPKYLVASIKENQTRPIGITFYYLKMILVTTPAVWLLGLTAGVFALIKTRKENDWFVLWWLFSVLLTFSFFGIAGGGTRYIFFVYPAIGMTTAVGWHFLLARFDWGKYLVVPIILSGLWTTFSIHPYYLDYYNELVGGVFGATQKGYEVSWWGEGQREVGLYLNEVGKKDASVAFLVTPQYVMPAPRRDFKKSKYGVFEQQDYVVISQSDYATYEKVLLEKYELIYEAKAGGVALVSLWQKK